jgi:hypothetical protein
MSDDSLYPGWQCVCEAGDLELARAMLQGHGIESEIAPIATVRRYSLPMLWVKEADFDRAALLVNQMAEAMKNPPSGGR